MKYYLLGGNRRFYKTNLHCHTNISDGKHSPKEIKESYKALGYSAVCYTDHEVLIAHNDLCDSEFVALHGYEVAIKKELDGHTGYLMPVYHFNFIAEKQDNLLMPRYFANNPSMAGNSKYWLDKEGVFDPNDTIEATEYNIDWLNKYLCAVRDAGFLITYNHPEWSMQSSVDYLGLKGLHAIETMNTGCRNLGDCSSVHLHTMLLNGMTVIPVGGDDNHSENEIGKSWTMICASELNYDALISAYKDGACYASTGPEIFELYVEDGKLFIKTSPASIILLRGEGRYISKAYNCSEAVFEIDPKRTGKHFRLEIRDKDGNLALTRAYCFEEVGL